MDGTKTNPGKLQCPTGLPKLLLPETDGNGVRSTVAPSFKMMDAAKADLEKGPSGEEIANQAELLANAMSAEDDEADEPETAAFQDARQSPPPVVPHESVGPSWVIPGLYLRDIEGFLKSGSRLASESYIK